MTRMPPLERDEKGAILQPHEAYAAAVAPSPAQPLAPLALWPELEMNFPPAVVPIPVLTIPQVAVNRLWLQRLGGPTAISLYQGVNRHPNPNAIQGFVMEDIAHLAPTWDPRMYHPVAAVQTHQFLMPVMAAQMPAMAGHDDFHEAHQEALMADPRYSVAVPGLGLLLPYPVVSTHVDTGMIQASVIKADGKNLNGYWNTAESDLLKG